MSLPARYHEPKIGPEGSAERQKGAGFRGVVRVERRRAEDGDPVEFLALGVGAGDVDDRPSLGVELVGADLDVLAAPMAGIR